MCSSRRNKAGKSASKKYTEVLLNTEKQILNVCAVFTNAYIHKLTIFTYTQIYKFTILVQVFALAIGDSVLLLHVLNLLFLMPLNHGGNIVD